MPKTPICPRCEVEMKEGLFSRSFGNPITIVEKISVFICPRCNFEAIPENEYENIRKKLNEGWAKEASAKAKLVIL